MAYNHKFKSNIIQEEDLCVNNPPLAKVSAIPTGNDTNPEKVSLRVFIDKKHGIKYSASTYLPVFDETLYNMCWDIKMDWLHKHFVWGRSIVLFSF